MKRDRVSAWSLSVTGSLIVSGLLAGCGDGGSTALTTAVIPHDGVLSIPFKRGPSASGSSSSSAQPPQIQGTPARAATVGQAYSFQPQASGPGSLTFVIANKPAWASFDQSTGLLTGTPTQTSVGDDLNIEISVTNGSSVVSLAPFDISVTNAAVQQSAAGTVTLSWRPPTENTDGTALADLAGYNIHYGTQPQDYTNMIKVINPGIATYVIDNLPAGTYYFTVAAYNASGTESSFSPEVPVSVN